MARQLPPLNSLKAFEAAARHTSFTLAANELGVTHGAISKQVRILEDYLGVLLFVRGHQQLGLTEEGRGYLLTLSPLFDQLELASDEMKKQHGQSDTLSISVLPSMAQPWLIPMLTDFQENYPWLKVKIEIGDGPLDFDKTPVDIAIRVSRDVAPWKHYAVSNMMMEELIPVASPALLDSGKQILAPQDIAAYPLLEHTSRPMMWEEYLTALGHPVEVIHRLGFEHFYLLIQAVKDKLGIALIPRFLIKKELADGSLRQVLHNDYQSPYGYYLITQPSRSELKKIRLFRNWLLNRNR